MLLTVPVVLLFVDVLNAIIYGRRRTDDFGVNGAERLSRRSESYRLEFCCKQLLEQFELRDCSHAHAHCELLLPYTKPCLILPRSATKVR